MVFIAPPKYTCGDLTKAVNDSVYFTSVHGGFEPNPYNEKTKTIYAYAVAFAKDRYPKSLFIQEIKENPLGLTVLCQTEGNEKPIADMVSIMVHSNPNDPYSDEGIEQQKQQEAQAADQRKSDAILSKENAADRRLIASWKRGTAQTVPPEKIIVWMPSRDGTPKLYQVGPYQITLTFNGRGDIDYKATLTVASDGRRFSVPLVLATDNDSGLKGAHAAFAVVKLDPANPNYQVMASYNTGGNHEVQYTKIADLERTAWKLIDVSEIDEGDFKLPADVDGDGIPDIVTFLNTMDGFADSSADEWLPAVIFDLANGALRDVTASSDFGRKLLAKDVLGAKKSCLHAQNESPPDPNAAPSPGACAAYVLDTVRLDHSQLLAALEFDEQQTNTNSSFDTGCKVALSPQTYECPGGQEKWHSRKEALVGTLREAGYISNDEAQGALAELSQQ